MLENWECGWNRVCGMLIGVRHADCGAAAILWFCGVSAGGLCFLQFHATVWV